MTIIEILDLHSIHYGGWVLYCAENNRFNEEFKKLSSTLSTTVEATLDEEDEDEPLMNEFEVPSQPSVGCVGIGFFKRTSYYDDTEKVQAHVRVFGC